MSSMRCSWLCGISRSFLLLSPAQGQVTYVLLTRSPLISKRDSFDLHVLGLSLIHISEPTRRS